MSRITALVIVALVAVVACTSDQEPELCPTAGPGDLVITEIRGNQGGTSGEWFEVVNTSSRSIDLYGAKLTVRRLDGGGLMTALVRRSLPVAAGARAVLGAFPDGLRPTHVSYGWHPDMLNDSGAIAHLPDNGAVDLEACDVLIDRVVWDDLPSAGTRSLGLDPPDAVGNDTATAWCVNNAGADGAGTPGMSNPPCP